MGGGYSGTVIFFFMKKQLNDQTYKAPLKSAYVGEARPTDSSGRAI
jgi:hypothetical protein